MKYLPTPSISAVTGALNIEEIVLTNLEAVTNSRLRVDPHVARQLEDVKITRYLDEGNVENWADTLSCGFCRVLLEFLGTLMNSYFILVFNQNYFVCYCFCFETGPRTIFGRAKSHRKNKF